MQGSVGAYAPRFPKHVEEGWWLVLGEESEGDTTLTPAPAPALTLTLTRETEAKTSQSNPVPVQSQILARSTTIPDPSPIYNNPRS